MRAAGTFGTVQWLILAGAALLAAHPLLWLIQTWREPSYNPQGLWIALTVAALFLWSWTSEQQPGSDQNRRYAFALLAMSAAVRLAAQLLRVNVLGAITLALDVYALATLAGLRQRARPVSPLWLSLLFAFSLPLERVVQRLVGFGLQQLSASASCKTLGLVSESVQCFGNRILIAGQDVLVDLPCSGARGLLLLMMAFVTLAALKQPRWPQALLGLAITLAAALAANILRITLLALGLAWPPFGIDLMQAPWHELLGLVCLALGALPILVWALRLPGAPSAPISARLAPALPLGNKGAGIRRGWALAFVILAAVIVSLPARPVDVTAPLPPPALPAQLIGYEARPSPLTPIEQAYFTQFGGGAARASYGPFTMLMVSTTAPLRHLHAPDECLRGSGYAVRYLGMAHGAQPSALYRATDTSGQAFRVRVSYVSERGEQVASVAHAVWLWLRAPGTRWTMIQRVAPWDIPEELTDWWDAAALRALDLPAAAVSPTHRVPESAVLAPPPSAVPPPSGSGTRASLRPSHV